MKPQFHWFDDRDYVVSGPFASFKEAADDAQAQHNHTRHYTIVRVQYTSAPPSLKRRWREA